MSFVATAVIGSGAISAGASLFGGLTQAGAEKQAAGTIAGSTQQAIQQLLELVQQGQGAISSYTTQGAQALQGLIAPFTGMGAQAGSTLTSLLTGTPQQQMNTLQSLPGFQFSLNTGLGGINNAATTSGLGGNVLTAANNYAQGTAQQYYQNYANLLQGLTNTGASAATSGGLGLSSLFGGAGQNIASLLGSAGQSIGGMTQAAGQNIAQTQIGAANALAGGVTGAAGGLSSSVTNALLMSKLLGTGSSGGLFSDIRLKEDVVPVGKLDNDLTVYSFRYKGSPTTLLGLIAQQVEKVKPEAVKEFMGFKTVDYAKAVAHAA